MTQFLLLAASAVLTVAAPAMARETNPAAPAATSEQPAPTRAQLPAQQYCIVDTITGSRIPQKKCQSRAQWLKEGFDPLAKND